jgi:putative membrane-bound dehydrogenase-like protein
MKISSVLTLSVLLVLLFNSASAQDSRNEFRNLFDGSTLAGWEGSEEYWRVEEGAIVGEIPEGEQLKKNHWLIWKEGDVDNFELRVQFRLSGNPRANSGIQFRCQAEGINTVAGYQADLDQGATWLGRIYDEHGRKLLVERGSRVLIDEGGEMQVEGFADKDEYAVLFRENEWNEYRIIACDEFVSVEINGTLFSQMIDRQVGERDLSGQLAFQLHSGGPTRVEFRSVQLRELQSGEHRFDVAQKEELAAPSVGLVPMDNTGRPLNLGFEDGTLKDWTAEGDAFEGQPTRNETIAARWPDQVSGKDGDYFIAGFEKVKDAGVGSLTSVPFKVAHPWASLLVSGGARRTLSAELVLNDESQKVIQLFRGKNREEMERVYVDLSLYTGKEIFLRLVDNAPMAWGHINFDDFRFHPERPPELDRSYVARVHKNPILSHLVPNPLKSEGYGSETTAKMSLEPGFEVDVIAAEPDIHQPIAFTFDAKGRIWVIEAHSYPTKRKEGEGLDKIVIFEDADADGTFETRKVFMEGLNLASGIELGHGGVWVGAAPQLLFIPDRDGNDIPDSDPVVLLDGFGYQDTHETMNSLIWGPDGWLYGNQGIFNSAMIGKPGASDKQRTHLTAGVWRYHPTRHQFEIFARGFSNPWSLDFNEMGQLFITYCRSRWGGGPTSHVVQGGHYWNQANKGHASFISGQAPEDYEFYRNYLMASSRYGHGEGGAGKPGSRSVYGGHSLVGSMIYLGDNWPDNYRDHLFTHNLHGHQINHQINLKEGSGYNTVHAGKDVLYSPEPTYVAVELKYGPDGSVFFSDWVDLQHCHNPVSEQWDRGNGRLYRMAWADTFKPVKVDLENATDGELVQYQLHRNDWYSRIARRLLSERANRGELSPETKNQLEELATRHEDASRRLRGLWALHGIGGLSDSLGKKILEDENEYVRAWTIQLLTDDREESRSLRNRFLALAKTDPSPVVRLYLASAIQRLPASTGWKLIEFLSSHEEDASDLILPKMIWFGMGHLIEDDAYRAAKLAAKARIPVLTDYVNWYSAKLQGKSLDRTLTKLTQADDKESMIEAIALGLEGQRDLKMPRSWPKLSRKLYASENDRVAELARQIGATFGDSSLYPKMREILADSQSPLRDRKIAFSVLADALDPESTDLLVSLLDEAPFTMEVIQLAARLDRPDMADILIQRFDRFNKQQLVAAMNALTQREEMAVKLLDAIKDKTISKAHLTAYHARELSMLGSSEVDKRLSQVWGRVNETPEAVRGKIEQLDTFYAEAPLWAFRAVSGKAHFNMLCSACHQPNKSGTDVGPNLSGSGSNGARYFLENIIDPNAVVGSNYEITVIETKTGQSVSGMIENQTETAISLRTLTDTLTIAQSDIVKVTTLPQSMMPAGLLETLNETQVVELLKYLTAL